MSYGNLLFRHIQFVLLTFGGQMGKQSTSGFLMAYWEQFVFRVLPNFSRMSPEEPRNNS